MMFEKLEVAGLRLIKSPQAIIQYCGKSSAIAVDCGHTAIGILPITEGFP